jgi:hypothetical protein
MPAPHKSESDTATKVTESVLANFGRFALRLSLRCIARNRFFIAEDLCHYRAPVNTELCLCTRPDFLDETHRRCTLQKNGRDHRWRT